MELAYIIITEVVGEYPSGKTYIYIYKRILYYKGIFKWKKVLLNRQQQPLKEVGLGKQLIQCSWIK